MSISRIWDLRRGDADDNRASPYSLGMRRVVLSALVDFNLVKASIGFIVLIVGPALLVGLAPVAVVAFGRLKWQAATHAGGNPAVALAVLAVLAGFALWICRPLLATAIDNFWHLHYTLVFPIFVILRELMRMGTERLPGKPNTPEQLHRRRRAGAVLAALVFAAAGAGLAWRLGFAGGLRLMDAGLHPWLVTKAALRGAALVLGLSTVVESIYWLRRELTLRDPVLDWTPGPVNAAATAIQVAHLSDLHLVGERYGYRMESGMLGPRGNTCMRRALRKLSAIHASTPLDRILVTGDVTDAGTRAEWLEFLNLLREHPEVQARTTFVPGNHDVNIVDRANSGQMDLPWSTGRALRKLRVLLAMDEAQGDRVHLVDRASGALGPALRDYLRQNERAELLRELAEHGSASGRREVARVWNAIFPLVEPAGDHGYGVILLNSNARSHFSLTNAIGVVDRSQLAALRSILRSSPAQAWMIVLHHQVVEYPLACIGLRDRIGLALVNAADVLASIAPHASRILVLHGHRHRDWIGTYGKVVLCSAPSVTLGAYGADMYRGSFHLHQVAIGADGSIDLATIERVKVG
jgi:3',5'-cyclic AMP phosphodiesterase CpdA